MYLNWQRIGAPNIYDFKGKIILVLYPKVAHWVEGQVFFPICKWVLLCFFLPSWNFDSPTLICKPWTSSTEWQSYTTHACKDMAVAVATLASQVFLKFFKRWWGFFLIKKLDYLTKIQGLLFQGVCSNWYTIFFYLLSLNTFFYSIDERWVIQTQLNKVVRCIDLSYLN